MQAIQNLLKYWYSLEFFSPFWPNLREDALQGSYDSLSPLWSDEHEYEAFNVYLGCLRVQDMIEEMLRAANKISKDIDTNQITCCLCGIKLDSDGNYLPGTFSVARFIFAVAAVIRRQTLEASLTTEDVGKFNAAMEDFMQSYEGTLSAGDLREIHDKVLKDLGIADTTKEYFGCVVRQKRELPASQEDDEENDTEQLIGVDMFPSFFADEIRRVQQNLRCGSVIEQFCRARGTPRIDRVAIDMDTDAMRKWLHPSRFPMGRWPSRYSPSLMQQLAVNIAIADDMEEETVFSVNGPPGTGKTTLLKEIVASNVVARAKILCEYGEPDDAFTKCELEFPEDDYIKACYIPDERLVRYGMLVASSNNGAVENISVELPQAEGVKESLSGLFALENEELYFTDTADRLFDNKTKAWGLISARLGRKRNIGEVNSAVWFDNDVSLRTRYKAGDAPDWNAAKETFLRHYERVMEYRKGLERAADDAERQPALRKRVDTTETVWKEKTKDAAALERDQERYQEEYEAVQHKMRIVVDELLDLEGRIPFYKRWFRRLYRQDVAILEHERLQGEYRGCRAAVENLKVQLRQGLTAIEGARAQQDEAHRVFIQAQDEMQANVIRLEEHAVALGANCAINPFWSDITRNRASQLACPWTNETYDILREELFFQALQLTKAFFLNSKCAYVNLMCLGSLWAGKVAQSKNRLAMAAPLLNTFMITVPVVSTTFASVGSFLGDVGENALGTLLIDEAGQAVPYAALGALWRTRKAIVVGDPLQIEPVVTVPQEIMNQLAERYGIDAIHRSSTLSVQSYADAMNPFGGYREQGGDNLWVGCPLVVHRRCAEPMFTISNRIAYNGRMFGETTGPKEPWPSSAWLDVRGKEKGGKNHYVSEQGKIVAEIVKAAFQTCEKPDLYIISPFVSVVYELHALLRNELKGQKGLVRWLDKNCGTIHTFQGKEAKEVVLVLGCDAMSGMGAVAWAGQKPNILNVAVTRAKYRLIIIGDASLWKDKAYFSEAYRLLTG